MRGVLRFERLNSQHAAQACGLVVTVFSDLPSLRLFGWLSAFSMVSALVADLFILRPTAMWLINLHERIHGAQNRSV